MYRLCLLYLFRSTRKGTLLLDYVLGCTGMCCACAEAFLNFRYAQLKLSSKNSNRYASSQCSSECVLNIYRVWFALVSRFYDQSREPDLYCTQIIICYDMHEYLQTYRVTDRLHSSDHNYYSCNSIFLSWL
jgi:hypothetical protein